jgi:nucleoside-diphosphate-sugar epimerase
MFYDMMLKGKLDYLTTHERDFTHVDDVVHGINILVNTKNTPKYVDIGTGVTFKVNEVAHKYGYGHLPIKETTGERLHTKADTTYMRSLGWYPTKFIA